MNRIRSLSSVSMASRVLLAFLAGIAIYAAQSAPVFANAAVGMASKFPLSTTVGATNVAAFLDFTNTSTPSTLTITVNTVSLTPSCALYSGLTCTTPDNGVFAVSPTGTGRTGTACAGVPFTFTPHAGSTDGQLDVTPMTPIVLGVPGSPNQGDECIIDFTFDVLKAPAIDALTDVTHPGLQTLPSGLVTGTASDFSSALGFGTTFITVDQALPAIATVASAGVIAGNTIEDTATLSAGVNPTGSITFNLYGPNDATCSTSIFSSTIAVSANGNYVSAAFTAAAAGIYRWIAAYSGDGSNTAVSGTCNAANENVIVTSATPTISTVASGTIKLGAAISDTAALVGGSAPTGLITFNLYGPGDATCSTTPAFTSSVAVNGNGNYPSASFTPTSTGTYRWVAVYGGDASNAAVAGACGDSSESVVVAQATPAIATVASAAITIGGSVTDTATLSGTVAGTGSITFTLYGPNDATCSATAAFTSNAISVSGNGSYTSAPAFTPTAVGTYRWRASYTGDGNNQAVTGACNATSESVVVSKAGPTIATLASTGGAVGTTLTDTATLALGSSPTGTIIFTLYGPNDATCTTAVFTSSAVTVAGNGPYSSDGFAPTAAGVYRWRADYSGDANNNAVAGVCNATGESATIDKSSPAIATVASAGGVLGTASLTDVAQLTLGSNPTGTITFTLYGPNDATCSTAAFTSNSVSVSGNGSYTSTPAFTPTAIGTYRWRAAYSGDANNNAISGACNATNESAIVTQAAPAIVTLASGGVKLGTSVTDTATLSSGVNPTGSITFRAYGPNDATCSTVVFTSSPVAVNGNASYPSTPGFTPTLVGTYRWIASYSGDASNLAVAGACNDANESVVISQATPTIATTASTGGAVGTSLTDNATLSGGTSATGSITFSLYGPNDATCANAAVFTSSAVTVAGNGTYTSTPAFVTTATGTYRWRASYSGDAGNAAAAGACNDTGENVTIATVTPTLATTASAGVKLGNPISDTANLTGGLNPSGTITFRAYGPNDASCSTAVYTSSAVTVSGNASYASTPSFTPTAVGTYRFIATYSGDANNASLAGACGDAGESVVVSQVTAAIVTSAASGGLIGASLSDQATLSGGATPTGTITFTLYGPNDASCSTTPVFTSAAVTVTGNGNYPSGSFAPTTAGTYRWRAAYSGDAANAAVSGACNDANESATITGSSPTLVTQTSASVDLGSSIHDTATLAGGMTPTGAIVFKLYGPNDAACGNPAIFTTQATISGNGSYASPNFAPNAIGTYRWLASYAGDANNVAISA
ncbi:MAG: hypothetical protein ABI190_09500, partial [Casimicrobiaceae bacterium]